MIENFHEELNKLKDRSYQLIEEKEGSITLYNKANEHFSEFDYLPAETEKLKDIHLKIFCYRHYFKNREEKMIGKRYCVSFPISKEANVLFILHERTNQLIFAHFVIDSRRMPYGEEIDVEKMKIYQEAKKRFIETIVSRNELRLLNETGILEIDE